ncbi:ATP-grasp domain-containing protein [[Clostridium] innocuum]|uniref:ATP-grasp domain-containing protein n=2 Tax=Bacillota TaxID=1239 RepID=UPI001AF22CFF|nr:ATP-grasp domain-containing protein [[Clostridium] innocuum]QSI24323.1 ATP-grasp domain-containing protein [Erysipelotrichaceae bacterium 66202529]MCC2832816.1 ATP-grasp domain-containing protein [[Clostridium] innocuum]MCR0248297.1 ATP-grasp domain-containing protein [[Clostridium] innocuum]MCR0260912.1 ATP-grasp domain-containing protein [[Clostridium] innocuum]MCR0392535.1 ATP-grasp domain-containing protein [[Clostridium] innocuum]
MKKVIILGAGIYQVPLIKCAKSLGYYTIVCSIEGNYPGFKYADKVYYINTIDKDAILEVAIEEKIDGIVTAGTDVAVNTIGYVCDKLGLKGLSAKSAEMVTDKSLMKKAFFKGDVSTAKYFEIKSKKDLIDSFSELTFPLIIKAVDLSGSRGIIIVETHDEALTAFDKVMKVTHKDYCIVEEFITGVEFGAQAFMYNGKMQFVLPHGDYVFQADTGIPIGHFAPYNMGEDIVKQAIDITEKAAKALNIDNAAMNCDYILKDNKVYVIEIGARSGATCLAELVSIYYDVNYYEIILKAAVGEIPDFSKVGVTKGIPNASMLLYTDYDGIIKKQENNITEQENVVDVSFDYQIGDAVHAFKNGTHRIGQLIVKGSTLDGCEKLLHKCLNEIAIEVE